MKELQKKIAEYLSGKMSAEEAQKFLEKYHTDKGKEELSGEIDRLWDQESQSEEAEWDPSGLFSRIQQVKENQRYLMPVSAATKEHRSKRSLVWTPGKIAAAIIFILVASGILWISDIKMYDPYPVSEVTEIIKSNPVGQKSTIYLPDGSKVVLNSASKITYFSDFGLQKRTILLDGEAWFEVKKDPLPFVVFTHDLATTALGTSFNICAYDEQTSEVALVTGKVSVEHVFNQDQRILLDPGESALLNTKSDVLEKSTFDIKTKTLWKDGVIYFDHTALEDAIKVLERWYGVEISIENEVPGNLYCTGVFKNDYLNNVLESIGFSLGFQYEIDNKTVTLIF